MATRATETKSPARRGVRLAVAIDELQLILDLSDANPKDPRPEQPVRTAATPARR